MREIVNYTFCCFFKRWTDTLVIFTPADYFCVLLFDCNTLLADNDKRQLYWEWIWL